MMYKNWLYCCLFFIASLQSIPSIAYDNDSLVPLLDLPYKQDYLDPAQYSHKTRISLAIALSILITASTNATFPEETIGYFTNQLTAELIAAAARDTPIFKKFALGVVASMLAASIDWYYMYPNYKKNLGLGIAGTQTCIMFLRDWLLEEGLGLQLPRMGQRNQRRRK